MSTRTSANGCLNARSTFSPDGRYLRPAATSARRNSPIAAIRSATGSSASAQPASMMLRNGSAMGSTLAPATDITTKVKTLWAERVRPHAPVPVPARSRRAAMAGDGGERRAVAGRGAALVVVEVDVHVYALDLLGPGRRDPVRPGSQRRLAIARPSGAVALVEPQVAPVGRPPQRGDRGSPPVRPAQRRVSGGQDVPHVAAPPRLVPGVDRDADLRRELAQAVSEQPRVGPQVRRQLQQHWPESVTEPGGRVEQPAHRLGRVAQPPHVGEVAAGLDRHHEAVADPLPPAREGLPRRQPVKGPVVLDRGELARVVLQPAVLRDVGRVERAPPVPVLPARGPDQNAVLAGGRPPQTPPILGGPIPPDPPWGGTPPGPALLSHCFSLPLPPAALGHRSSLPLPPAAPAAGPGRTHPPASGVPRLAADELGLIYPVAGKAIRETVSAAGKWG